VDNKPSLLRSIGPGILMAAVAVGASHLVQSTRAGAEYGLALAVVVVMAMASKYPAYRFCPRYTSITGVSMIEGFARQGLWALILFCISALGTVFVGGAGITMVAAGILKATFSLDASPAAIAIYMLVATVVLLIIGRYHWLDLLMKPLMLFLVLATVVATVLVLPNVDWGLSAHIWPQHVDLKTQLFMIALFGWMPAPLEAAVITSLWSQAKARDIGYRPSTHDTSVDFHVGYITILLLSFCFMLLGTGLMFGKGISFVDSAGGFASQLIDLYEQTLGEWTRPFMGIMALSVMYSTVIAHLDGFSRITDEVIWHFEQSGREEPEQREGFRRRIYNGALVIITASIIATILFLMTSFKTLIDISATIAFVATPVFAILIHRAMMSRDIPAEGRPGRLLYGYSLFCNLFLSVFAAGYLVLFATT
jgi:Mn2+/Fe2+ NRAMP family transporter